MRILVTGGTGFIGQALLPALEQSGHTILLLSRQSAPFDGRYESVTGLAEVRDDAEIGAIINLSGASMAGRRWTTRYKRELIDSRLETTRALVALVQRLQQRPEVLLSASAIGYYGHHGDETLTETGAVTPGFAQALCADWEHTAQQVEAQGVRVCLLRLGVVLDAGGGAFEQMYMPFRLGVGNYAGDGRQWLSWIHRDDVVAAILFLLEAPDLWGPVNLTAPEAVTGRGFCQAIQRQKRTLLTLPVPGPVMRLMVGEMAEELLLNGQRVVPAALQAAGFKFRYPTLDDALPGILGR